MSSTPKPHAQASDAASPQNSPYDAADDSTPDDIIVAEPSPAGGASGSADPAGGGASGVGTASVARSGNQSIDGLLATVKWSSTSLTYSFPTSSSNYGANATVYGDPAPFNGFSVLTTQQQNEVKRAFSLLSSYTKLTFNEITETNNTHAAIRLANSSSPPTSYAFYPSTSNTGGDVFYGGTGQNPVQGNFDSGQATLHEIGHALGLKHGQDNTNYGTVPANQLDIEYSLMNYPNYIGSTEGFGTAGPGSSEQTYMMYDIAALQYMYGANMGNAGSTFIYTWSPTTGEEFINGVSQGVPFNNHIFETVWTGGATSTYDLHVYAGSATLDLRPGAPIAFSAAQRADLGYFGDPGHGVVFAQGNIYNALLYNNDISTEVSGLIAGNGNDIVYENDLLDNIQLGTGNDTVYAGVGGGSITGGGGTDTLVEAGAFSGYTLGKSAGIVTVTDSLTSRSGTQTMTGVRYVQFSDQTVDTNNLPCFLRGTAIATVAGERPVETLRAGDVVRTHDGTIAPIVWAGRGRARITARNRCQILPVIVRAGALGADPSGGPMPRRDLHVTRDHAILVPGPAGPVLVAAEHLVNDVSVVWDVWAETIEYFHLELAHHAILLAEGAPAESFRDDNSRHLFDNRSIGLRSAAPVCLAAPLVTGGPALDHAWREIAARAPAPVDPSMTDDPDLHVLADGRRLDPLTVDGEVRRFVVAADVTSLTLASRHCIPAALGLGEDRRRLGVAVCGIVMRRSGATTHYEPDAHALSDGFHAPEGSHRWTAGAAVLPPLPAGARHAEAVLDIHIASALRYRTATRAGVMAPSSPAGP